MYPAVVLAELVRVGAVRVAGGRRISVIEREYFTRDIDLRRIKAMGSRARDVLSTLARGARDGNKSDFVTDAMAYRIDPRYLPLIRSLVRSRSRAFVQMLEQELGAPSRQRVRGGVRYGVYVISTEERPGVTDESSGTPSNRRGPKN